MTRKTEMVVLACGMALFWGSFAQAGTPQIVGIRPFGVQRGVSSEVTIGGSNLAGNPRLIGPFAFRIDPVDPKRSSARAWTFKLTVLPDVALGVYPVRVQTDDGLSNPFLFAVGQLPQFSEKEDNSTFEAAQALPAPPLVVEGQAAGNDVDYFRFAGKKGQVVVVDAQCARIGSGVDPSIRLTTAAALAGGSWRRPTTRLGCLPTPGWSPSFPRTPTTWSRSRIRGTREAGRPVYRLLIGPVPVADEVFPLGGREGETLGLELRGGTLGGEAHCRGLAGASARHFLASRPGSPAAMLGLPTSGGPGLDVESLHPLVTGTLPELREPADPSARPLGPWPRSSSTAGSIRPATRIALSWQSLPDSGCISRWRPRSFGSALDGVLQVQGMKGSVIANADDTTIEVPGQQAGQGGIALPDPSLDLTVPGGTTEISLVLRRPRGTWRRGISLPDRRHADRSGDSTCRRTQPQVSIPRGGTAAAGSDRGTERVQRADHRDRGRSAGRPHCSSRDDRPGAKRRRPVDLRSPHRVVCGRAPEADRPGPRA